MQTTFLSIGLVHRYNNDSSEYLVRLDANQNCWTPIVAERLEKESFRESVIREISWSLELDRNKDFLVSSMASSSQEYVEELEEGIHHYAIAFYRAKLFSKSAREKISQDTQSRWIKPSALCEGVVEEGQVVEPNIVGWINRWSVLNPWE